ncbi:MAG: HD domain-containing protein [Acidimicrobiales bacterium]
MNPRRKATHVALHLVHRFCGGLWPWGPAPSEARWVAQVLSPTELALWARMGGPDRRHSVVVARRAARAELGRPSGIESRTLLAAALLHDVGKAEAGLGTSARVIATLVGMVLGKSRLARWTDRPRLAGRIGRYLAHDRLGAALLDTAGSHALVVAWAEQHHLPSSCWEVPQEVGALLKAADDN